MAKEKHLVAEGLQFKVTAREVDGVIRGEQGIPCFYAEEEGLVKPLSFPVEAEMFGEEVTAIIRNSDGEIILELGEDEVLEEDLTEDQIDISDSRVADALWEEQKVRLIPKVLRNIAVTVIFTIVAVVMLFLKQYIVAGCLGVVAVMMGVMGRSTTKLLNQTRIYDEVGNWVDCATGDSSLDAVFKLKKELGEEEEPC